MRWIYKFTFALLLITFFLFASTISEAIGAFVKSSQNPVITTNPSSWESNYVWQPSSLLDGSSLKLWYSGYNGSRFQIGLATSSDGVTWSKNGSNPVVSRLSIDNKDAHDPTVIKSGTSYEMWYVGSDGGGASNYAIYRATSNDGTSWTNSTNPVFKPSSGWGSAGPSSPFVLKIGSEYKMWFSSADTGHWSIGLATSSDGINWTPYASNPVLTPSKSWEGNDVDGASVMYDGTTYEIFYHGSGNLSYATSTDGITWTKPADKNPVLTRGASFDNNSMAGAGAVRLSNGTTLLYYGANGNVGGSTTWRIGVASDGPIVFTTPTPTPSPTPTPIPPIVIIPGMFASWNGNAILHNSTVTQSDWKMNSIVHEYDGLLTTLRDMGFIDNVSLFIYPYDWRKKLETAASELDAYIAAKIPGSTKVDLIGHSLGGMVGRIYAQKYGTAKIDKLITVGSPHQGIPQAYKAFGGGEIDRENNLQWLALKLMLILNRGSGKTDRQVIVDWMPVIGDLIPIYTFLTRLSDGSTVDSSTMTYKNDTLLTYNPTFSTLFPLFQSIVGESAQTLSGFTVNNPSSSDVANNIYPDGRPVDITQAIGDTTVVSSSAKADSDVKVLNAGHGELIYKKTGIKEIVSSLGLTASDSAITEGRATGLSPSLLFFIKSPATMTVDYNGTTTSESDGMIFLENAESGTYTLKVTGTSKGKYTVVVGQIKADNDYWDNITGEITKDPPSSQIDSYTINYPSNPLFPSSSGTGGSSSTSTTTTSSSTPTPTPTPAVKQSYKKRESRIDNVLGATNDRKSVATPVAEPIYEIPRPMNPSGKFLQWIFVSSGILLLILAFFLSRRKNVKSKGSRKKGRG